MIASVFYALITAASLVPPAIAQENSPNWRWQEEGKREISHVLFQAGDFDSIDSYMENVVEIPDLYEFTICTHIKFHHVSNNNTLISYFAAGRDNELSIFTNSMNANLLQFFCCNNRIRKFVYFPIRLYTWEHLCITVNLKTKVLRVILNNDAREYALGETDVTLDESTPLFVKGGGRLVLGQDLDTEEGGFSIEQVLSAEIADFSIYDIILSLEEIKTFMSCRNRIRYQPMLYIDKEMTVLRAMGETNVTTILEEDACAKISGYSQLFPERVSFRESAAWCRMLQGWIVIPTNERENREIYDKYIKFSDVCTDSWRTLFYFGINRNITNDEWHSLYDKKALTWSNFDQKWNAFFPNYTCAGVGNHLFKYTWFAVPCTSSMCSVCNFTETPKLRIRGLCPTSLLDRSYYLHNYYNNRPIFDGESHSRIVWTNETWELRSRRFEFISATMEILNLKAYPLGLRIWNIVGDRCPHERIELMMTSCTGKEFTCSSGICIPKTKRCDLSIDCKDQSDELNCDVVNVPDGYSASLPPPKINDDPLDFGFFVRIITIRELNLVSFSLVVDAMISIMWKDSRLTFRNLRDNYEVNKVRDLDIIWTPKILVRDGSHSAANMKIRSRAAYVMLEDKPLPDDITVLDEDDRYSGKNNTLILETEATLEFTCQFMLHMYPVDRQRCYILVTIPDFSKEFGRLKQQGEGVAFNGTRKLLEYELVKESLLLKHDGRNPFIELRLDFKNLYGYYIGNTFVPSLFLVLIVYLTFYFDPDDFENRIMVSLMSLLVLATFFTETSSRIPRTSYLKLIDAWYVALLCQNFMVIVSLVVVENLRLRDKAGRTIIKPMGVKTITTPKALHLKANFLLKFIFPTILAVNLITFFSFWTNV